MSAVWPLVLLGLAGILVGGAFSLYRQGAGKVQVAVLAAFALLAGIGGIAWLLPES